MRYKLKHRVLSFILALTTMLTTANLPQISLTTYAADPPNTDYNTAFERGIAIKSNADEHDIIDFAGEGFKPLFAPEIQTIRVTLIKTGESDNSNRGYPTTGKKPGNDIPEIQMNPIHMVPWDYDTTWGDDEDKVRSVKNVDIERDSNGLTFFNSRREYTGDTLGSDNHDRKPNSTVTSYGTTWMPEDISNPNGSGHWVFDDSKFQTDKIADTIFCDKFIPNCITGIGGDMKAYYQQHPPTQRIADATTTADYIDAMSQAVFQEDDEDNDYHSGGPKQCFIYHVIAYMTDHPSNPYCDEVDQVVQKVIAGDYRILLEPTITLKMGNGDVYNPIAKGFFGGVWKDTNSGIENSIGSDAYVTLTAGDLGTLEDIISTVWPGATSRESSYHKEGTDLDKGIFYGGGNRYRGYNPISHNPYDNIADIIWKFYDCLHLKENHDEVGLFSPYGLQDAVLLNGNLYKGNDSGKKPDTFENTQKGSLWEGKPGPLYSNPFYKQVAEEIEKPKPGIPAGNPSTTTCLVDMASLIDNGAIYIVKPQFSQIDYTISGKGLGEQSGEVTRTNSDGTETKLPVYEEGFNGQTNEIIFTVDSKLKMTDPETNTATTNWVDKILDAEPDNYSANLPSFNGTTSYEVKDIDASTMTEVFIPAMTGTRITATYTDEKGNPISFNQADGTPADPGASIITPSTTGSNTKLYIDNIKYYSFNPQTQESIPYTSRVSDARDPNKFNDSIPDDIMSDATLEGTNYIKMKLPTIDKRPANAMYVKIRATVNLGSVYRHGSSDAVMHSRPAEDDSSGTVEGFYATAYENGITGGNTQTLGEVEKIEAQKDNMVEFLIPLVSYDLSADTIFVNIVKNPMTSSSTHTTVNNISIATTSSSTAQTETDFCGKTTGELIYTYATKSADVVDQMQAVIEVMRGENDDTDGAGLTKEALAAIDNYIKVNATSSGAIFAPNYVQGWVTGDKLISNCSEITPSTFVDDDDDDGNPHSTTLNWDIPSSSTAELTQKVNTLLEVSESGETIYVIAVHAVNSPPHEPTPPLETKYKNNIQIGVASVVNDTPPPPPDLLRWELTCYPKTKDGKFKNLTEANNWSKCETTENLLKLNKDGITQTSLGKAATGCMLYGASLKVDGVSNDMHLGKRTTLKYVQVKDTPRDSKFYVSQCQHGNKRLSTFPKEKKLFKDGGILDSVNKNYGDPLSMHQEMYKYIEWEDSVNKYVIKNQIANEGYYIFDETTHLHCGSDHCYSVVKVEWVETWALAPTQDNVYYTVLFDHNYAQNIHNSMIYSIDSLLANSNEQGKYSYIIEAGSKFGVNLQERVISDLPASSTISLKADAYYHYDINNAETNKMNSNATQAYLAPFSSGNPSDQKLAGYSDRGTEPLPLFSDYTGTTGNGAKSQWAKSNESYNRIFDDPYNCDGYLIEKLKSGKYRLNKSTRSLYTMNLPNDAYDLGASLTKTFSNPSSLKSTSNFKIWGFALDGTLGGNDYKTSPSKINGWKCSSGKSGGYSDDVPTVRYYRFVQPANANSGANGFPTNPDYPDSIKVDPSGKPIISNTEAASRFIGTVTPFERAMGYVGLRVNLISYVSNIKYSDGKSGDKDVYLNGSVYQSAPEDGSMTAANVGSNGSVMGDCTTYSLVVAGSTSNRYTTHSGSTAY